jgi:hypothetical protein
MEVNYHILPENVVITYSGKLRTIRRDTQLGQKVISLIKEDKLAELPSLLDVSVRISKADPKRRFEVIDGEVCCYGEVLPKALSNKILGFVKEDLPFDIFLKFWEKLSENPSKDSQEQLYRFLEANHFPLTPDGCFIGYKAVRSNFKDLHSGQFDNAPGNEVSMARKDVTHDPGTACSEGLHVASYSFAKGFRNGDSVVIEVKVNPADVVSVPNDAGQGKARVCKYLSIGVVKSEYQEALVKKVKATPEDKKKFKPTGDQVQIGRNVYTLSEIDKGTYERGSKGHRKICEYDRAQVFKDRGSQEVFRKAQGFGKFSYYEKNQGKYYQLVEVEKPKK